MERIAAEGPNAQQIEYWNDVSGARWVEMNDVIDGGTHVGGRLDRKRAAAAMTEVNRGLLICLVAALLGLTGCAPQISRSELASRIESGSPPPILDVRSAGEFETSHVPGAVHVPFYSMLSRSDEIPTKEGEPLVVYCEHGPRAGLARVGLWMAGAGEIRFLEGHMIAWKADGLPVEFEDSSDHAGD